MAKDATWKKTELFGSLVADLALRALESGTKFDIDSIVIQKSVIFVPLGIQTVNNPSASIDFREETLHLKLRWDPEQFRAALVKTFGAKSLE